MADLRFFMVGSFDECVKVNTNIRQSHPVPTTNISGPVTMVTYDHTVKGTYFVTKIEMPPDIVPESSRYLVSKL